MCNHPRKHSNVLLYVVLCMLLAAWVYDRSNSSIIEQSKRYQARDTLIDSKQCITKLSNYLPIHETFVPCLSKSRTSFTGDAYVLDVKTLEFVYDASKDVPKDIKLYFTKESVGKYFRDWGTAEVAKRSMLSGKDSKEGVNAYYLFDDDVEWLEWIYLPDEDGSQYIIVQGTQRDEVFAPFTPSRYVFLVSMFLLCTVLVFVDNKRRLDDRERHNRDVCTREP